MMNNYADNDNDGLGWLVKSVWQSTDNSPGQTMAHPYHTLGAARQEARQLSCCAGIVSVQVVAKDSHEVICSYERSSNRWVDHDEQVKAYEAHLSALDFRAHQLAHVEQPDAAQQQILKDAARVGGIAARSKDHAGYQSMEDMHWNGRVWVQQL